MSLRAKVKRAVDTAFSAVGDLAVNGTLSAREVTGYDFGSRGIVSKNSTKTLQVIILTTQKPSDGSYITSAMMKSGPDLSGYDTLTVGTTVYNVTDYSDDGFAITATIVREES